MILDYIPSTNTIVLRSEDSSISLPRRLKFYLASLGFTFNGSSDSSISISNSELSDVIDRIIKAFEKYDKVLVVGEVVRNILNRYFVEEENFKKFSEQARGIWNNKIDKLEFQEFCDVLYSKFPRRTLYDKQLLASYHLAFSQNACNFSVPGAGKTSVVYGAYAYLNSLQVKNEKFVNSILVVGPLSSFGPWEIEYEKCFGKKPKSARLSGGINSDDRNNILYSSLNTTEFYDLVLISYQSIHTNLDGLSFLLSRNDLKFMVVLDEAHKIKNTNGGIWAESTLSLAKLGSVKSRVILTGTPAPNGYQDIYNLYQFIWPDKDIIRYRINQLIEMSSNRFDDRIETLIQDIEPFYIRIKKEDILPESIYPVEHNIIKVKMDSLQEKLYNYLEQRFVNYITDFQDSYQYSLKSKLSKAKLIRIMQVASNPYLLSQPISDWIDEQYDISNLDIEDQDIIDLISNLDEDYIPPKFRAVGDLCLSLVERNEKVIIWALFTKNLFQLQQFLRTLSIESKLLYGGTPTGGIDYEVDLDYTEINTRERIIEEFHNDDSDFNVIIANPFAVSESISLHKACHHAIYLEKSFNASAFIQSKDRIHRVGLKESEITNYYYFNSSNSIDETIHRRLLEKESQLLDLIERNEIPLIASNSDYIYDEDSDIKAIIKDYVSRNK